MGEIMPFFWLFSSNITLYKYINQQVKLIVAIVQKIEMFA